MSCYVVARFILTYFKDTAALRAELGQRMVELEARTEANVCYTLPTIVYFAVRQYMLYFD